MSYLFLQINSSYVITEINYRYNYKQVFLKI